MFVFFHVFFVIVVRCIMTGASPGFGRGGGQEFFSRFGNLHVAKRRGISREENLLRLMRFGVYFETEMAIFIKK